MSHYRDFTDFLNDKFAKDEPMTLDDEWPDKFNDWLVDQDVDTLVKYADEYAQEIATLRKERAVLIEGLESIKERCIGTNYSDYKARLESGIMAVDVLAKVSGEK